MDIVRLILKEAGGRLENAAGSINSDANMYAGSSGNAPSDKVGKLLGKSGTNNPIEDPNEGTEESVDTSETIDISEDTEKPEIETTDVDSDTISFSDEQLKNVSKNMTTLKGKLKNLELDPMKAMSKGNGNSGGGNLGSMANMFQGIMGADSSDMSDMADAADAASDERLKNIFGENEDAIKAFARINAIEFTYNDKAHDIPGGENKGIDDDVHYGVKAQELAENPFTESAVSRDPISDYLQIDVKELTTANTAIISEICKRLLVIEKVLGIKVV